MTEQMFDQLWFQCRSTLWLFFLSDNCLNDLQQIESNTQTGRQQLLAWFLWNFVQLFAAEGGWFWWRLDFFHLQFKVCPLCLVLVNKYLHISSDKHRYTTMWARPVQHFGPSSTFNLTVHWIEDLKENFSVLLLQCNNPDSWSHWCMHPS